MNKLVALLCASIVMMVSSAGPAVARNPSGVQADEAVVDNCSVRSVAAFVDRVHVLCVPSTIPLPGQRPRLKSGAIRYFAVQNSASTSAMALAVLSVAHFASQRQLTVTVTYRTDPKENPPGCLVGDCRQITGIMVS